VEQQIRYCTAADGARIAYATAGAGPAVVITPVFPTHLERDWLDSGWQRIFAPLSRNLVVRYDERGTGLSERTPTEVSLDGLVRDLEAVVDAAGLERFALVGLCQSSPAAIRYTVPIPRGLRASRFTRGTPGRSHPSDATESWRPCAN
jgi:pimeloyl-ACP methyl ester carboxylesterase